MKTILVPTDFSLQATYALTAAHQLAKKWKARLVLVHVIAFPLQEEEYPVTHAFPEPLDYFRKAQEEAMAYMQEEARKYQVTDVEITYKTLIGTSYLYITRELSAEKADLVVMGSKGTSGIREIFIGFNAERMVRFAPCPVMVIKEQVDLSQLNHIIFATTLRMKSMRIS